MTSTRIAIAAACFVIPESRMPSSSENSIHDNDEDAEERLKRGCESFFAMRGAALVLPHSKETQRPIKKHPVVGELQQHLQSIFWILRPEDTIKMAVKLETSLETMIRYMVLVSCLDTHQNTEETIVLGVDILGGKATIGMVLPIWADTGIHMGGDGGFTVTTGEKINIFKPVSIQAMWSALQALYRACDLARIHNFFEGGLHMTWIGYYQSSITSPYNCLKEWDYLPDIISPQSDEINYLYHRDGRYCPSEDELIRRFIFVKLKEVMINSDLETVTSKMLRNRLEVEIGKDLSEYRKFIDKQILLIYGQLDSASKIFDHIYLGSEWNASNLDELKDYGVGYILNITKECDNFFPDLFQYCNIRLYDMEVEDLLKHWDATYRFLSKVKEAGSKALVHCKMGVSRSASTVIAYAMKEYGMSLEEALAHVKERRAVIRPNKAFMKQLQIYEGILEASRQRHTMFRSKSESSLSRSGSAECLTGDKPADFTSTEDLTRGIPRNKSWSTRDNKTPGSGSPEGAVGGTTFYIGPDPTHLGAGKFVSATSSQQGEDGSEIDCSDITVLVPTSVRPSSIVKLQKTGALASGEVPFLVQTEHSTAGPSGLEPSTVLASEDPSSNADSVEGSSIDDTVFNTNNNSANELSLDGSEEALQEQYKRICVKSKVTEIESNVMGAIDPSREDEEDGEDMEVEAYRRESIPWNPGTVLRQKQEIEEKMRDGSPTSSISMKFDAEMDEGTEGVLSEEGQLEEQVLPNMEELVSSAAGSTSAKDSTDMIPCSSVLEQHSRTASGKFDQLGDGESGSAGVNREGSPMDMGEPEDSTSRSSVYTTSGEEIQLAMGLVERHKREFELKKAADAHKPEMESDSNGGTEMAVDATESSGGSCNAAASESMETREGSGDEEHRTAYPEEQSGWKLGDVRRHTMELEGKIELASSPSPTKKSACRIGKEGDEQMRLTDEEMGNIQNMEEIPLRTSSPEHSEAESEGLVGVAEQVKNLELKRCASIAKMSNEKVKHRTNKDGSDHQSRKSPTKETIAEASLVMHQQPDEESSASGHDTPPSMDSAPKVELNPDLVRLFTSQLGGKPALESNIEAVERKKTRKSESDKDKTEPSGQLLKTRSQHGPSHPLNKLSRGGAVGRGGSSRGKFYSTM